MFKTILSIAALCLLLNSYTFAHDTFVYVSNYGDGTISQFRANSNGALTPLNPPSVKAWPRCHNLAADPSGRYLYVLSGLEFSRRNCMISEYRILNDGRLTPLFPLHVSLPYAPYLIMIEPSGRFLYVLNHGGAITQFHITHGGTLAVSDSPGGIAGSLGFSIALDRQRSIFYASAQTRMTNEWLGSVSAFRPGKNGRLYGIDLSLPHNGCLSIGKYEPFPPLQVVLSQSKNTAYILYQGFAPDGLKVVMAQYRIQTDGELHPLKPLLKISPGTPQETIVDPKSRYCYVFVLPEYLEGYPIVTNKIILVRYRIESSGLLGQSRQQVFTVPNGLFSPVFDPSGRTLYLLTRKGILIFRVEKNGSIMLLPSGNIHAGNGPLRAICVQN